MAEIHIVAVGRVDANVLDYLAATLPDNLGLRCVVGRDIVDPALTYNATRVQYHSTQILARLLDLPFRAGDKTLGVCEVDLFIPILTFVFGEAQLNNRAALISVHRLRQSFYGLPTDERLFYERCEKEAMHELGHAFGLVHCRQFECVMHFSNSIEQVDLKEIAFCATCSELLAAAAAKAG